MTILLLSVLPVASILAVLVYAAATGIRMYRANGQLSVLGIAVTLAGFSMGRLVDRFASMPRHLDDWINYRDEANNLVRTKGDRFLAVLSVEVALLFLFAAVIGFLAVTLIRRDAAARLRPLARRRGFPTLASLFVLAVGITVRSKLAAFLAFLMAKGHLL